MTEVRDVYNLGNPQTVPQLTRALGFIFSRIADRLDRIEGLRANPRFYSEIFEFITEQGLSTGDVFSASSAGQANFSGPPVPSFGTMALQDANAVAITGGSVQEVLISIRDEATTIIHQYPLEFINFFSDVTNFYRENSIPWRPPLVEAYHVGDYCFNEDGVDPAIKLGYGTWQLVGTGNLVLT